MAREVTFDWAKQKESDKPIITGLIVRTKHAKMQIGFELESFSRTHGHFAEKTTHKSVDTVVYSLKDTDIKFQFRFKPGKHNMQVDGIYLGSDPSASIHVDLFLLGVDGRRVAFDYGRKVEINLGSATAESLNNFLYDRDELERRRDKIFNQDKLVIGMDVDVVWCAVTDA
jgi:hypothetical protein